MGDWQPIEQMKRDRFGYSLAPHVVVGWWFAPSDCAPSWETDTDESNDCATHFVILPNPPATAKPEEVGDA